MGDTTFVEKANTMTLDIQSLKARLGERSFEFNLTAHAGEVHAILGKSGSGKSTLLNLIGGFVTPLNGTIKWKEKSISSLKPEQRPVTTLFQSHNLFDHLNVRDNVALGISPNLKLDTPGWHNVDQVFESVGLSGRERSYPADLSGGEQQRVGLARCLLRKRPILLLDEPYGALDETTRSQMLSLTQQVISSNDLCVVMVTHNEDDAKHLNAIKHNMIDGKLG